ncbi:ABC transporter ATP-binding protein [Thermobrachium celere]|uniref:ABC transporter ATP-binding protein n=1 Tax=Thermobrachium celere TaxID=53422 RepID=UPI001940E8C2|nr:ABC transporter ATP-binding protein [Thermobrachium celere]GFR34216.1 ABC transporter ATP-binding protein [Thermobrachium celere]
MEDVIVVENLFMDYGSGDVLKGISFKVPKGQIVGYIGPNGAGKSTTIRIFLGMTSGYRGTVKIFGEDIRDKYEYKRRIGYVPEIVEFYDSLTPIEYLNFIGSIYGLEENRLNNKIDELLNLFDLYEVRNTRISSFSKGMKQKLAIISSIIHNPDLIFFDEPITGLDANSAMVFKEMMQALKKEGKTIFYSSHIMEVVEKVSDRIILLNDGQIVADGNFYELKKKVVGSSLEDIFNTLTGFTNHSEIASKVVEIINS